MARELGVLPPDGGGEDEANLADMGDLSELALPDNAEKRPAAIDGLLASIAHVCANRNRGELRCMPIGLRLAQCIAETLIDDVAAAALPILETVVRFIVCVDVRLGSCSVAEDR